MTGAFYAIGYGNRRIADFVTLLKRYGVRLLVDVRSKPYSRVQPDFGHGKLREHLEGAGLRYRLMREAVRERGDLTESRAAPP